MKTLRSLLRIKLLSDQFPALHGLRVLGILAVIQVHFSTSLVVGGLRAGTSTLHELSRRLWFSMDLFFVMSGFLIGTILISGAQETDDARGFLKFYARRSFRIIPAYYVVLTILALTQQLDARQWAQLPREYLYLTNYSDTEHVVMLWGWSLCVEEHFYLAVPFLVAFLRWLPWHEARIGLLGLLWLSGALTRAFVANTGDVFSDPMTSFHHFYIPTHIRYDTLMIGVLLAYVMQLDGERVRELFSRRLVRRASIALTGAISVLLLTPLYRHVPMQLLMGTVTGLFFVNLFAYLVSTDGWATRLLGHRAFLYLATLGYGVYLVHYPIVYWLGPPLYYWLLSHGVPGAVAFALGVPAMFAASLPVAYALHLVVEKPALRLRDRLVPATCRARA